MSARLLVVEDEYFIAQEIADALLAAGYVIVGPCATVPAALALLGDGTACDAAVLDASLRHVSSLPVADALAERGIPFAVVTGFTADQLPPRLAEAPVLTKPVRGDDLVAMVRQLLASR